MKKRESGGTGLFSKKNISLGVLSVLAAFFLEYGQLILRQLSIKDIVTPFSIVNIVIYILVFFFIFKKLFLFLDKHFKVKKNQNDARPFKIKRFFLIWLVIFSSWVPVFLAYYPGIWGYDVDGQLAGYTLHHPLIHSIILHFFVENFNNGNANFPIALLSIIQMLSMSVIFAFVCEKIRTIMPSKKLMVVLVCFFAFVPINPIMAISATKDTMFAGFFVLCVVFVMLCRRLLF